MGLEVVAAGMEAAAAAVAGRVKIVVAGKVIPHGCKQEHGGTQPDLGQNKEEVAFQQLGLMCQKPYHQSTASLQNIYYNLANLISSDVPFWNLLLLVFKLNIILRVTQGQQFQSIPVIYFSSPLIAQLSFIIKKIWNI